jgi:hypothetical protein
MSEQWLAAHPTLLFYNHFQRDCVNITVPSVMILDILINSLVARLVMELLLSLRMDLLFLIINHEI